MLRILLSKAMECLFLWFVFVRRSVVMDLNQLLEDAWVKGAWFGNLIFTRRFSASHLMMKSKFMEVKMM